MNVKNLLILTVFVVGLAPNNTYSDSEYCAPCNRSQNISNDESENTGWKVIDSNYDETAQLVERLENRYPADERQPARTAFQDKWAPCDTQFQERVEANEKAQAEEKPYVIIYRVK